MSDKPTGTAISFDQAVRGFADVGTQETEQPEPEAAPEEELTQEAEALSESEDEAEEQLADGEEAEEQDSEVEDDGETVDGDEDDAEEEEEPSFTIQMDGKEQEVTLSELRDGYMRQADYTRKTQAHAEQRKTLETQAEQAAQKREELIGLLEAVPQQLLGTPPDKPDINLIRSDPQAYEEQKAAYEQWYALKGGFDQWRASVVQERDKEVGQKRAEAAKAEGEKFVQAFAEEVKDEASMNAKVSEIHGYLHKTFGYAPEELAGMIDHRAYRIADKARRYDELMAGSKPKAALKAKKAKIKPASSNAAQRKPKRTSERDQARKRFDKAASQTGQQLSRNELIESAAAAFAQSRSGGG